MADAKPAAARERPWWVPLLGISLLLPLAFSLFAAPMFAAVANPDSNAAALTVNVVDFDGGLIGAAFSAFWAAHPAGSSWVPVTGATPVTVPGIRLLAASSTSPDSERAAVRSSAVYASIFVNAGASAALTAALSSPAAAAAYDPSAALTMVWDEARNNAVTASRVAGPLKGLTDGFAFSMAIAAQGLAAQLAPNRTAAQAAASYAAVLGLPVLYREESLFPMTAPVLNQALAVGQILLCVFSLVAVNMVWGPLRPLWAGARAGLPRAARVTALLALLTATVTAAYATALIGLANSHNLTQLSASLAPGVAYGSPNMVGAFSGPMWAQVWACQWLMMLVLALWLALAAALAGTPAIAAALLAPMIIFNSISLNTDVSDPGYKFFYYAPFWHSSEAVRSIMFGTLASRLPMHIGIHFLWLGVELLALAAVHLRGARAEAAAAAAAALTAGGAKAAAAVEGGQEGAGVRED
jgi:hypothetical protein